MSEKPTPRHSTEPGYALHWPGKQERPSAAEPASLRQTDAIDGPPSHTSLFDARKADFRNRLIWGDNLAAMEALLPEFRGRIDLIYLDPPYDARHDFRMRVPLGDGIGVGESRDAVADSMAYRDTWGEGPNSYVQMLYERLPLIRDLLSETGSLFVHVNWRVNHLVQVLLDEVFGPGDRRESGTPGFRCEIVWGYGGGTAARNVYRRKHDNLYWYTRSDRWTFNPQYRPYTEGTRQRGLTRVKGPQYSLREEGATLETWWTDPEVQKILSPTAYENLKYPTQKPEGLLARIIQGHSNPGDLVADFFCGSGTTGAVAEKLDRRWIMADSSRQAVHIVRKRMAEMQEELAVSGTHYRAFDLYEVPVGASWRPDDTAPPAANDTAPKNSSCENRRS